MKKKILIPTDFSKNAWDAIIYALELYKNDPCDIYFMNAYSFAGYVTNDMVVTAPSIEAYKEFRALSENKLKETIEAVTFRFQNSKHTYHSVSEQNNLYYAIVDFIGHTPIDLLVMGTKGETNSAEISFGSNAVAIMEKIESCPILMIPETPKYTKPKEIVFATDFNGIDEYHKLDIVLEIVKQYKAKLCVVHVNTEEVFSANQEANKIILKKYLANHDYEIKSLSNNTLFSALNCFVQSRESDIVTFFSKKHSILKNIFSKPLVKSIGKHSKIPVLILH